MTQQQAEEFFNESYGLGYDSGEHDERYGHDYSVEDQREKWLQSGLFKAQEETAQALHQLETLVPGEFANVHVDGLYRVFTRDEDGRLCLSHRGQVGAALLPTEEAFLKAAIKGGAGVIIDRGSKAQPQPEPVVDEAYFKANEGYGVYRVKLSHAGTCEQRWVTASGLSIEQVKEQENGKLEGTPWEVVRVIEKQKPTIKAQPQVKEGC